MRLSEVPRVGPVEPAELYMGKRSNLWQLTTRFTHVVNIKPLNVEEQCTFITGFYGKLLVQAVAAELVRLWKVRNESTSLTVRALGDFLEGCRIYATEQQWFPVAIPDEEAYTPTDALVGSPHRRVYHAGGASLAFTCASIADTACTRSLPWPSDACIVLSEAACNAHKFVEYVVVSGRDFYFAE